MQRGREARRCFRVLAAGDDQLALSLRSLRQPVSGRRDLPRSGLQVAGGNGELTRHGRQRVALFADFADDVGDGRGRAVDADTEVSDFVGGVACASFHLLRQVATFDLAEHATRVPQPLDDLREHGNEGDAGEDQHESLLQVQRPWPAMARDLRYGSHKRKRNQIGDQRAPGVASFEI